MKRNICELIIALSAFPVMLGSCGQEIDYTVPSSDEYRKVLEERKSSVNGADIDIRQLVDKYNAASNDKKREMYDDVKRRLEE